MHQLADKRAIETLNLIRNYSDFLSGIRRVCDMGCGTGDEITWWATLTTDEDEPVPYNFVCYAVDKHANKLAQVPGLPNIKKINRDFEEPDIIPASIDLLWCHDSLQYATNPLQTLKNWNSMMTTNGMMIITVPQYTGVEYNRYHSRTRDLSYFNYTIGNLIYMLAVNGFDTRDAYVYKPYNDPWIRIAVYKSSVAPMDPKTTSLRDLCETELLHWSVIDSIKKNGFIAQEEIVYPWFDKENYFIEWIPQRTEFPAELANITPAVVGIQNQSVKSGTKTFDQAGPKVKSMDLLKPINILRPPKGRYVKR